MLAIAVVDKESVGIGWTGFGWCRSLLSRVFGWETACGQQWVQVWPGSSFGVFERTPALLQPFRRCRGRRYLSEGV